MDEDDTPPDLSGPSPARGEEASRGDSGAAKTATAAPGGAMAQWITRAQAGSLEAFEQIVLCYEKRVFGFLRQFTRNTHDAEDLTQETFIKAHQSLARFQPGREFLPWLFTIARRTAASYMRSARKFEELSEAEETAGDDPSKTLEARDERESIWGLARMLKPNHFEVLWLRYHEGFSIAETAGVMRTNGIYVKVLLHRARAALARQIEIRGGGKFQRGPQQSASQNDLSESGKERGVL